MDFFKAQDDARKRTAILIAYYALAVVVIILAVNAAVSAGFVLYAAWMREKTIVFHWWDPDRFLLTTAITSALIAFGSLYKMFQIARGGATVARMLGGRPVVATGREPGYRRLYNVVEEMAIASGLPVPDIFALERCDGINAFSAGHTIDDAAIAISRGAIELLDRDELQAVVAHEFSHILNGDMRLNTRLIGILHGIMMLSFLGRSLSEAFDLSSHDTSPGGTRGGFGRRRGIGGGGGGGIFILVAVVVIVIVLVTIIGYIGTFFARLIQAAILRQREYLADASALQFTRNPQGVASALKKVGGLWNGGYVPGALTPNLAHLFFVNALWSTGSSPASMHPPLPDRIRRIDSRWDGSFPKINRPLSPLAKAGQQAMAAAAAKPAPPPVTRPTDLDKMRTDRGRAALDRLPDGLRQAARDPDQAPELLLATLLASEQADRESQLREIGKNPATLKPDLARELYNQIQPLDLDERLTLVEITLPALSRMTSVVFRQYQTLLNQLIRWNHQTSAFEFLVRRLFLQQVAPKASHQKTDIGKISYTSLGPIRESASRILSLLALEGANDEKDAERKLTESANASYLLSGQITYTAEKDLDFECADAALDEIRHSAFALRRHIIDSAARCVAMDAPPTPSELALLRAFSSALGCPLPRPAA